MTVYAILHVPSGAFMPQLPGRGYTHLETDGFVAFDGPREFFIIANSFAAPFFSDSSEGYQNGTDARDALEKFAAGYKHPCGLYSADAFENADAYHKNAKALAQWRCNRVLEQERITGPLSGYSILGPGAFEVNGVRYDVKNPAEGRVL